MLDMEALRSAFADIDTALDEISRFRREALPTMAGTILELDTLTAESEQAIENMERGRTAATRIEESGGTIDVGEITAKEAE
jgi:uncharacterized protein YaaN involved in tellurite resistance